MTIEHLNNPHYCWYPNFYLIFQHNTILLKIIFALESSFELHNYVQSTMILGVLPKHIQALDYDYQGLLYSQRHEKGNGSKLSCQL